MIINCSEINYTSSQATEAVLSKVNKRGIFDGIRRNKKTFESTDFVKLVYFPYWVGFTISNIYVKVLGRKTIPMIVAVEGFKGESGISLGLPETTLIEVDDSKIVQPIIDKDEANSRIISYTTQQIMKKNRHIPNVTIPKVELVWKPTYIVQIRSDKCEKVIYKFVDAESNYLIYRYDLEINKLKSIVPELASIAT